MEKVERNSKENTSQAYTEQKNVVKDDLTNHRKEITEYSTNLNCEKQIQETMKQIKHKMQ